jgi:hypothetical protein
LGNKGILDILTSMGFRTFSPVINESYDDLEEPAARIDAVFQEIDRLMSFSFAELKFQFDGIREVMVHNFVHLLTVAPVLFGSCAEARLRRQIATMVGNNERN